MQGGFGGTPTADSRFAVPCPSDRNALRNPPRQHVPTVVHHFRTMKHFTKILTLIFLVNGCTKDNHKILSYCDQEIQLLKGNSSLTINFDFGLDKSEQFENMQSQVDKNLCNSVVPLNGKFGLSPADTINILIFSEKYCENDTTSGDMPCFLTRSLKILINKKSEILFENDLIPIDSLATHLARHSKEFFIDNEFKYAVYDLEWEKETPTDFKKLVFKQTIDGYLFAANKYSQTLFQKNICALDSIEIQKITRKFRMVIGISDELPPAPTLPKELNELIDKI